MQPPGLDPRGSEAHGYILKVALMLLGNYSLEAWERETEIRNEQALLPKA